MLRKSKIRLLASMIFILALAFVCSVGAEEEVKFDPAKEKSVVFLNPTSDEVFGSVAGKVSAKQLAANTGGTGATALYGFSTGVSKEKGSFKLGVLLADVTITLKANDKEKSKAALKALIDGLGKLRAPAEMIESFSNLNGAMAQATDVKVLADAVVPIMRPFINKFVTEQGMLEYLTLGEHCEGIKLVASRADANNIKELQAALVQPEAAQNFVDMLSKKPGTPEGVTKALNELAALKAAEVTDLRSVAKIKGCVDNILQFMS
ncbi:MAG: hypothetical protein HQK58_10345 [Deltaproteobacteria bacterium]|nr:hypothetical protein [Deltaproteobacteria bacterium]